MVAKGWHLCPDHHRGQPRPRRAPGGARECVDSAHAADRALAARHARGASAAPFDDRFLGSAYVVPRRDGASAARRRGASSRGHGRGRRVDPLDVDADRAQSRRGRALAWLGNFRPHAEVGVIPRGPEPRNQDGSRCRSGARLRRPIEDDEQAADGRKEDVRDDERRREAERDLTGHSQRAQDPHVQPLA